MAKGLTGVVLGLGLMLVFYRPVNQFIFRVAGMVVLGALIYTVASIMAIVTHCYTCPVGAFPRSAK